jgi:hypothetical protein
MPASAEVARTGRAPDLRRGDATLRRAAECPDPRRAGNVIELKLRTAAQLFNALDPSPLESKDLDGAVEEFIVGWAQELPHRAAPRLRIRVDTPLPPRDTPQALAEAVRHYFAYRASISRLELRQLLKRGRTSLVIGLSFLSACLLLGELIQQVAPGRAFLTIPREGLTIGGWVALWRPMEIYLYDWWPIRRRVRLFDRLSRMEVELVVPPAAS